ncbi:(4Fe-4S)-binding protein [Lysinibacillus sp. MHQ-1]|nr:(4Fe-4S)-binding protein [Lysinibacillus sp. MHQ-1]
MLKQSLGSHRIKQLSKNVVEVINRCPSGALKYKR